MIFAVSFLLPSLVFAHEIKRYSGITGTAYNVDTTTWYRIQDFDSVGQCATLCTYHGCNMFETMLYDGITSDDYDFRGFRCYINIGDIK